MATTFDLARVRPTEGFCCECMARNTPDKWRSTIITGAVVAGGHEAGDRDARTARIRLDGVSGPGYYDATYCERHLLEKIA